ncbi:MAG TPA: tryptophan 7-halogenase, partial [Blastocatellia bacterium]|nr:tryptophan 7-halogenase [Blastocatellia bacterium]
FTGVRGVEDLPPYASNEAPPYPPDRAALHHVFDGGWIWVLPFNNGITSAGVAASSSLAGKLGFEEGESGWNRLLETLPTVAEQFSEATPVLPFVHARKLPFRSGTVVGDRWGMVASASGFVDPLLSTGFPLTLFSILRLAEIMSAGWKSADLAARLDTYASETTEDLLAAERLVAALYANMHDFTLFTSLSLLYFAAASYAETAGRLGKPELARSFLLRDHPVFGPQSRACLQQAMRPLAPDQKSELMKRIEQTIEPVNVAGLNNPGRRNWYPVAAGDLFDSAHKVNATRDEIEELLDRCGFFPGTATA